MNTISEIMIKLKKAGYTEDFNLLESCLVCHGNYIQIFPNEFVVDKYYRFEGISDPADEAIVYAISSAKYDLKGTLVNGYGLYSNAATDEMMRTLENKAI